MKKLKCCVILSHCKGICLSPGTNIDKERNVLVFSPTFLFDQIVMQLKKKGDIELRKEIITLT